MAAAQMMTDEEKTLLTCVVCQDTTSDPVLLPCLHSACRKCVESIVTTQMHDGEQLMSMACPSCRDEQHVPSEQGCGSWLKANSHVAARLAAVRERGEEAACHICHKDYSTSSLCFETPPVAAEYRCVDCCTFLCAACTRDHDKFLPGHIVVEADSYVCNGRKRPPTAKVLCHRHRRDLDLFCHQCVGLKCSQCVISCNESGHRFSDQEAHFKEVRVAIGTALDKLTAKTGSFESCRAALFDLAASRKTIIEKLQAKKASLLDLVTKTYEEAKAVVEGHLEEVTLKLSEASAHADLHKANVEYVTTYCRSLLQSNDMASLVDQQNLLLSRLQSLLDDSLKHAGSTLAGADQRIVLDDQPPKDMARHVRRYIGMPRLVAGYAYFQQDGGIVGGRLAFVDSVGEHRAVTLRSPQTFKTPPFCNDVAVMPDGQLLLATSSGLIQYDAGGREVVPPLATFDVSSVDTFADGRIAFDCGPSQLSSANGKRSITVLRLNVSGPSVLSAHAYNSKTALHRLAVAADDSYMAISGVLDSHIRLCGTGGKLVLPDKQLDYRVGSVATTVDGAVIVSSCTLHNDCFPVDAFSLAGKRLWRHASDEQAWDLCCDRWGHVYLALHDSGAVRVLGTKGEWLTDILRRSNGLASPWCLAMDRESRWLAVLTSDDDAVHVFPVIAGADMND